MWRSKPTLDDVLAECLSLLEEGEATLEGCLARYPELADDLRPLLLVALRLREGPIASASPATVAEGRRRLLERLAEERAKEPGARLHFPQILPSFSPQARLALSVVAMLIVLSAGVLLARAWVASPVAQTAELLAVNGIPRADLASVRGSPGAGDTGTGPSAPESAQAITAQSGALHTGLPAADDRPS